MQNGFPAASQDAKRVITLPLRHIASLVVAAALTLMGHATLANAAQAVQPSASSFTPSPWVQAWATAQQPVSRQAGTPAFNRTPDFAARTLRQIIQIHLSGKEWRLRLSNRYGDTPITITAASMAQAGQRAALTGQPVAMTFGGARSVTLAPGASRESDPVSVALHTGAAAVSLTVGANTPAPGTWHKVASQVAYVSPPGDRTMDVSGEAFKSGATSWLFIDALEVRASSTGAGAGAGQLPNVQTEAQPRVAVAIGDSITDGMRSSLNGNQRWPDFLARRLAEHPATAAVSVVDLGISGNRLLSDSPCYGEKLAGRFEHDAIQAAGARYIMVLIGINDINFQDMPPRKGLDCDFPHTRVNANDLISGYKALIATAHGAHRRIYGATLTPASLPPARESIRLAVNRWIRESGAFDAVIDFDQAVRDPAQPDRLLHRYDSDDHVHPNDAGYQAMAQAVPLGLFEH